MREGEEARRRASEASVVREEDSLSRIEEEEVR